MKVRTQHKDGSWTEEDWELPADLQERMDKAQEEWKALAEAGTPYWCIHEGRGIDHPAAYWQGDGEHDGIHRKHGIRCSDCGGYLQEG